MAAIRDARKALKYIKGDIAVDFCEKMDAFAEEIPDSRIKTYVKFCARKFAHSLRQKVSPILKKYVAECQKKV